MAKILIVDDERDMSEILKDLLESEGFEVDVAANGEQALARMMASRPNVILLDLMMPVMSGDAFMRALASGDARGKIPTLLISAHDGAAEHARSMKLPFLSKPYEFADLVAWLRCQLASEP